VVKRNVFLTDLDVHRGEIVAEASLWLLLVVNETVRRSGVFVELDVAVPRCERCRDNLIKGVEGEREREREREREVDTREPVARSTTRVVRAREGGGSIDETKARTLM